MKAFVNLADPALLPPKPFFQFRSMMLALGVLLLVLMALGAFIRWSLASYVLVAQQAEARTAARAAHVSSLEARYGKREKNPQLLLDLQASADEVARLQQIAASLPGERGGALASPSLEALAGAVMPGVWLEQVEWQRGALSLQGYALRAAQLPDYLESLRSQAAFRGQRFASFELGRKSFPAPAGTASPEALMFSLQARSGGGQP